MELSKTQTDFAEALRVLTEDNGAEFAAGYMESMAVQMLALLPRRRAAEFLAQVQARNGDWQVPVKNLMTGELVSIRRAERGGPCDPSLERYWSM
jgi:hypothetical protein